MRSASAILVLSALVAVSCATVDTGSAGPTGAPPSPTIGSATAPSSVPDTSPVDPSGPGTGDAHDRDASVEPDDRATAAPAWLGERVLDERPDGFGAVRPTPPDLDPRRIDTPDHLPPPATDRFASTVEAVSDDVLARSTWEPACPVARDELAYVTVSFWGFDGDPHTGELLVAERVADDVVAAFAAAHEARFPIEEMRIVHPDELDLPPTGDGNNTTAFVCRPIRGRTSWSQHAYGTAVDINPFHNPYVKGDLVLPERASTYTDRTDVRDGMLLETSAVIAAFDEAGWGWGGRWSSPTDPMHVSLDGT